MRQPKCRTCGEQHPLGRCPQSVARVAVVGAPRIGKTAAVDRQVAKAVKAGVRVFRTKPPAKNTEAAVREVAEVLAVPAPRPWAPPFGDIKNTARSMIAQSAFEVDKEHQRAFPGSGSLFNKDGSFNVSHAEPAKPLTDDEVRERAIAHARRVIDGDDGQPEPERLPFTDSDVNAQDPVACFLASPAGQTIPPEVRKVITDHLEERAERRKYMREYQRGRRKAKKRKAKR